MRGLLAGTVVSTFALAGVSLMAPPVRIAEQIAGAGKSADEEQRPPQTGPAVSKGESAQGGLDATPKEIAPASDGSEPPAPNNADVTASDGAEPPAPKVADAPGQDSAQPPAQMVDAQPQQADRPEIPVVEPPAGSEFTRERPDTEPVAPALEPAPEAPEVASPSVPDADATPQPADPSPPRAPEAATSVPDRIDAPAETSDSLPQAVADESPARSGERLAQIAETPDASPRIERTIVQPPAGQPESPMEAEPTPAAEQTEPEAVEPAGDAPEPAADLPAVITLDPGPAPQPADADDGQVGLALPGNGAIRLPRIGDPVEERIEPIEEAETPVSVTALERFAVRVERAADAPVVAVVLADDPQAPMRAEDIAAIGQPVTVAIDPLSQDAARRVRELRAAGLEVAILFPDMPENASASDVEVAWQGFIETVPEAIGIVSLPTSPLQGNRTLAQHVASLAAEDGHAMISVKRGLNAARQVAESLGVPNASIDRLLDARGESRLSIRRYLDMAALDARRSGQVVVLGRARPETVTSLRAWVADGASGMVVAPVSAVLLESE